MDSTKWFENSKLSSPCSPLLHVVCMSPGSRSLPTFFKKLVLNLLEDDHNSYKQKNGGTVGLPGRLFFSFTLRIRHYPEISWDILRMGLDPEKYHSREGFGFLGLQLFDSMFSHMRHEKNLRKPTNSFQWTFAPRLQKSCWHKEKKYRQTSRVLILVNLDSPRISGT